MFKMIIVDDERIVCDTLSKLDWAQYGIEVAGVFDNGLVAEKRIKKGDISVVLTDIKMPIMSGLELVEKIYEYNPDIAFVVVSGYDNFEYAQKFLAYNVQGYLMKPLNMTELDNTFRRIFRFISSTAENKRMLEKFRQKEVAVNKIIKDDMVKKLIHGEYFVNVQVYDNDILDIELDDVFVAYLLVTDPVKAECSNEAWFKIGTSMDLHIDKLCREHDGWYSWVDLNTNEVYIIIDDKDSILDEKSLIESIKSVLNRLQKVNELNNIKIKCGLSSVCSGNSVDIGVEQAKWAIESKLRNCDGVFIYSDGYDGDSEHSNYVIRKVIEYMENNFHEQITLQSIAEKFGLSASYLSSLFKLVTGDKFIDYLTMCRIEKAKVYLKNSDYKIGEIAEKVGYENVKYFSYVFKKKVGVTPNVYRNSV